MAAHWLLLKSPPVRFAKRFSQRHTTSSPTYSFQIIFCNTQMHHTPRKSSRCVKHPDYFFIGATDETQARDGSDTGHIVSVDLGPIDFPPCCRRLCLVSDGYRTRPRSMYTRSLIRTARKRKVSESTRVGGEACSSPNGYEILVCRIPR